MRLRKHAGSKPNEILFVKYNTLSGIGYLCDINSWGHTKRYVNNQHTRKGYLELTDDDVIPKINDKIFYI